MASRTADGKHTPRLIVLAGEAGEQFRSGNEGLRGYFLTREAAQAAISQFGSLGVEYKVRQK